MSIPNETTPVTTYPPDCDPYVEFCGIDRIPPNDAPLLPDGSLDFYNQTCFMYDGTVVPGGQWVLDDDGEVNGSTEWTFYPCRPIAQAERVTTTTTAHVAVAAPPALTELPETGAKLDAALIGVVAIVVGVACLLIRRVGGHRGPKEELR